MEGWAALLVALGGAAGSLVRYGVGLLCAGWNPQPTLAINVSGSLIISLVAGWSGKPGWVGPTADHWAVTSPLTIDRQYINPS